MRGSIKGCLAVGRGLLPLLLLCASTGALAQLSADSALCMNRTIEGRVLKPEDVNVEAAIAACERYLASPSMTDEMRAAPTSNRAIWLVRKKDFDGAIAGFTEALRLRPTTAAFYHFRAMARQQKGDLDSAIADYDEDIRLSPADLVAYDLRARLWRRKGDLGRAIADFKKALSLNGKYVPAANNLAWLLATAPDEKLRDGKLAVEYATTACEASEWKYPNALGTLAAAYAEAGDFDKAVQWQEKALKDDAYVKYAGEKARARVALYKQHQAYRE